MFPQPQKRWGPMYKNGYTYIWNQNMKKPIIFEVIKKKDNGKVYLMQHLTNKKLYYYFVDKDEVVEANDEVL